MKKFTLLIILVSALVMLPLISYADVIYASDDSKIEGEIISVGDDVISIKTDKATIEINYEVITKIVFIFDEGGENKENREKLKDKLKQIIETKPDIELRIKVLRDLENVGLDDYDIDNHSHKVKGIYLKNYYNKDEMINYKDKIYLLGEKPKWGQKRKFILGEIIDVDKNKIKIKTADGIITKTPQEIYALLLQKEVSSLDELPKYRQVILYMINYYNENYWEWKRDTSNTKLKYYSPEMYNKYSMALSVSVGYSPNYFWSWDYSQAAFFEILFSKGSLYNKGWYYNIGVYVGFYFDIPYYDGTPTVVTLVEISGAYTTKSKVFRPIFDVGFGLCFYDNGEYPAGLVLAIGGGFELMFNKNIGIRTLINYKTSGSVHGIGLDIGLVIRFDLGVDHLVLN